MTPTRSHHGQPVTDDLTRHRRANSALLWAIFLFSVFTNLLMLTGPLYMLQVYDRVLGSRSEETLLALSLLVTFLFLMMGLLDYVRGRVAARVGARLQDGLDAPVFSAALSRARRTGGPQTGLRDLESVQRLLSSPAFLAIFDVPWTPLFLAAIFIFHPWLGWLALSGGALLIVIAIVNQAMTREPLNASSLASMRADRMAGQLQSEAELIRSLGMQGSAFRRWRAQRSVALGASIRSSDRAGGFTTLTKTLRLFLQSAMLGLGAYLVLQGELTAGAMIAGSILMGRALAPIELAIGQWALIHRAHDGWTNLRQLLAETPREPHRLPLPRPAAQLTVHQLAVVPPGESQATLRMVSFRVEPGQAVGIIGPSGAGKSTLAKALTGVWAPAAGQIRLDGATLDQYDPDVLGGLIGYLPQSVTLFDGTIAENIARLAPDPDPEAVVAAARKAAAHDLILKQPKGYDTPVTAVGSRLSGGQVQRIGLARALYGDPVLLVLDEPNSNLDNEGSEALNQAIREMKIDGRSVLIMAHRPAAIRECDMLLVLEGGMPKVFGPRDEVLKKTVQNHAQIAGGAAAGGVS
ncbi:type I secretion system permease/ATPase [Boseongicola sp. H5]|uniref:type I secretion system permease/ATPase n=1 Tax=Boseongicola sp. H5 TaxID=2763261 RepID=UPI001D0AFD51|nr:type I secretion system permease/ATPase [Boseongicola sp. H5]